MRYAGRVPGVSSRVLASPSGLRQAKHGLSVCLVRPPVLTAPRSLSYYGAVPDLGLAYVAAAVRAAGHRVEVIDGAGLALDRFSPFVTSVGTLRLQGLDIDAIVERIPDDAEVIGFTHMFLHEWGLLRRLLERTRQRFPDALLVAGGENASAFHADMLEQSPALNACIRGEGEAAFTELLGRIEAGQTLEHAPSVAIRRGVNVVANPALPRLRELDALPWPAWDLLPVKAYLDRRLGSGVDRGPSMPVLTSRGCPYRCTFCSSPQMWTTRYVRRDPQRVLDEIEWLQRQYGITNVNINDLTALLTKRWLLEFCQAIEDRGLRFTWQLPSGTRSEAVDAEAARALVAAGCRNFCYAPESGSPAELRRIAKRVDPRALRRSLRSAVDAGMTTQASIIIGIPGQDRNDLWKTYRYILDLARDGLHTLSVLVFAPYPGSEEFDRLRRAQKLVPDDIWIYGSLLRSAGGTRTHHETLSARTLGALQLGFLISFFLVQFSLRPHRALEVLGNVLTGSHETVLETFLTAKRRQLWAELGDRFARWSRAPVRMVHRSIAHLHTASKPVRRKLATYWTRIAFSP